MKSELYLGVSITILLISLPFTVGAVYNIMIGKTSSELVTYLLVALVLDVLAGGVAIKSVKKVLKASKQKKKQIQELSQSQSFMGVSMTVQKRPTPEHVLAQMRGAYTAGMALRDMEIINDCINIIKKTTNIDTFHTRYELAMQKAYTLLQAKEAGIITDVQDDLPITILGIRNEFAPIMLQRSFDKMLIEAYALKTQRGECNRYIKHLSKLKEYDIEFEFDDTYHEIVEKLNRLIDTYSEK